ncbi:MAG: amidase [Pseudomonadota bacterium]
MIRRHPWRSLLGLIVLMLGLLAWQNRVHLQAAPAMVGAYSAKEYCSCRYVMGNGADYCAAYIELAVPLSGFFDDAAAKRVTARALGSTQTAVWLGPREGCLLLPQADALP